MNEAEVQQVTEATVAPVSSSVTETKFNPGTPPSTQVVAPPSASAPAKPVSKVDAIKKASQEVPSTDPSLAPPPEAPPAYMPNFKMKVDKQEKEIEEFYRGLIKDADSEKKVRETLQKAEAFESQTQRYERLKQDHESVATKYNGIDKSLKQLSKNLSEDDMESFCSALKIDDQKILRYAQRILQKLEMDPNQRAEQERIRNDRLRANQLEEQNMQLQDSVRHQEAEATLLHTEKILLSKPEYAQVAQSFDQHVKRDGAFFEEVCKQGVLAEKTTGKVLTPEEAIQAAVNAWSPFLNQAPPQAQVQTQMPVPRTPPPTIPNISGRGSSPIKQPVRSIADLKKLANQF